MKNILNLGADGKPINSDNSLKTAPDMTEIHFDVRYHTRILLVRHGQSIGNARREFLGHTDKDLSPLGYDQARRTADFLSNLKIDMVYSSDLLRAYNTALPNAKIRGLEVITSEKLREIYAGLWEGMKVEDIIQRFPDEFIEGWRGHFGEFTLPEGDSIPDTANRIYAEVLDIAEKNERKTILIGTHAAAIRAFWGKICDIPASLLASSLPFPDNASVSVVYYENGRLIPGEYSHSAHLSDLK